MEDLVGNIQENPYANNIKGYISGITRYAGIQYDPLMRDETGETRP